VTDRSAGRMSPAAGAAIAGRRVGDDAFALAARAGADDITGNKPGTSGPLGQGSFFVETGAVPCGKLKAVSAISVETRPARVVCRASKLPRLARLGAWCEKLKNRYEIPFPRMSVHHLAAQAKGRFRQPHGCAVIHPEKILCLRARYTFEAFRNYHHGCMATVFTLEARRRHGYVLRAE